MTEKDYFTKIEENSKRSSRLKVMRTAMKMKGVEAGKLLGIDGPYYSRKENGLATVTDEEVTVIKEKFVAWREAEVKRLQRTIDYLNDIV